MGELNPVPMRINKVEGAAGQVKISGGPGVLETWGAPALAVHGAAKHTNVTREIFLSASMGFAEAGTPTSHSYYDVIRGGADVQEPKVFFTLKVPDDFVSFTKAEALWKSPAGAGNMWWLLYAAYAASGEAFSTHTELPSVGATATGGANIFNLQEPANPLSLANLASGDFLGIYFWRVGDNASDTLDISVDLFGILFTYVAEQ